MGARVKLAMSQAVSRRRNTSSNSGAFRSSTPNVSRNCGVPVRPSGFPAQPARFWSVMFPYV